MFDLKECIEGLKSKRPVFHSEADFQHALAWEIHEKAPEAKVRLEFPFDGNEGRQYIDILVSEGKEGYAIELKYKKDDFHKEIDGEKFDLTNQSAQDWGSWGFWKDVERIEKFGKGSAIFLTNDSHYWNKDKGRNTSNFSKFRLYEDRDVTGRLAWADEDKPSLLESMKRPLQIGGHYTLKWNNYSEYGFRYLLLNVE